MKPKKVAGITFAMFAIAFVGYLLSTGATLPPLSATHFDWHGQPNGWMSRTSYLIILGSIGLGAPLLVIGLSFAVRFFPTWTVNIPHRDFWLAPERQTQTFDFLLRWALWFGCLLLAFLAAIHHLVVQANGRTPVTMPSGIGVISIVFALALLLWTAALLRRFRENNTCRPGRHAPS
jgi:uncharacterized membrane protein